MRKGRGERSANDCPKNDSGCMRARENDASVDQYSRDENRQENE